MKLPIVSRGQYEEMRDLLTQQIRDLRAELESERSEKRSLIDHLQLHSVGSAVFEKAEPRKPELKPKLTEDDQYTADITEARKHGYFSPRAIAEFITKKNEQRFEQARNTRTVNRAVAMRVDEPASEVPAPNPDFEQAEEEGKALANK